VPNRAVFGWRSTARYDSPSLCGALLVPAAR
jgi:hypothetical protein